MGIKPIKVNTARVGKGDKVLDGDQVVVTYKKDAIRSDHNFVFGEPTNETELFIEQCLELMTLLEVSLFKLSEESEEKEIIEIGLEKIIRGKPPHDNSPCEKLEKAKMNKETAIKYFQEERFRLAYARFCRSIRLVICEFENEMDADRRKLLSQLFANCAACFNKLKSTNYKRIIEFCSTSLKYDSQNLKALFRRGNAYLELKEVDEAIKDFNVILQLDATNKPTQLSKKRALILRNSPIHSKKVKENS